MGQASKQASEQASSQGRDAPLPGGGGPSSPPAASARCAIILQMPLLLLRRPRQQQQPIIGTDDEDDVDAAVAATAAVTAVAAARVLLLQAAPAPAPHLQEDGVQGAAQLLHRIHLCLDLQQVARGGPRILGHLADRLDRKAAPAAAVCALPHHAKAAGAQHRAHHIAAGRQAGGWEGAWGRPAQGRGRCGRQTSRQSRLACFSLARSSPASPPPTPQHKAASHRSFKFRG